MGFIGDLRMPFSRQLIAYKLDRLSSNHLAYMLNSQIFLESELICLKILVVSFGSKKCFRNNFEIKLYLNLLNIAF